MKLEDVKPGVLFRMYYVYWQGRGGDVETVFGAFFDRDAGIAVAQKSIPAGFHVVVDAIDCIKAVDGSVYEVERKSPEEFEIWPDEYDADRIAVLAKLTKKERAVLGF